MKMKGGVILVIRDGWGYRQSCEDNSICETPTPNTDRLMREYPNELIGAAGEYVGLPKGYQGNSEVGHMTIGAGRTILQSMPRINKAIEDESFFEITEFNQAIQNCKDKGGSLHIMGLLQSEGVHAHESHLYALLRLCQMRDFKDVHIHVFTDGRDAPVTDSIKHIMALTEVMDETGVGRISTICGRYYAMDRNNVWERTKKAYECIVNADTKRTFENPIGYVGGLHKEDETDEFIVPSKLKGYEGVKEDDSVIFYNFRTDRTRQLTKAIVEEEFEGWERKPLKVYYVAMTQFYEPMNAHVAFKDIEITNHLGQVVSDAGKRQLRISETEKYAHVTFFFNGQVEQPYDGEDRILIKSPDVATYDLKPEMSAYEITEQLIQEIRKDIYDLVVVNLVNGDMVGHTGVVEAIHKAVSAVDDCLGQIVGEALSRDYTLLVFADHGNAEDQTPEWKTSHTKNPVPLMIISNDESLKSKTIREGRGLKDIAATTLHLMGVEKPAEMDGEVVF